MKKSVILTILVVYILSIVIVGLIASAAMLLMNEQNFGTEQAEIIKSIIICISAFCLVYFAKLHPILVIILAGTAGYIIY